MTLDEFFDYLEAKARQHPDIPHDPDNKRVAFYAINDPYDLDEFDLALRNFVASPAMIAEENDGVLDDNGAQNYTETIDGSFMIVDKRNGREPIRDVYARCKKIGKEIAIQIRKDYRAKTIVPGEPVHYRIDDVRYQKTGELSTGYYGYLFTIRFICPFSF